MPHGTGIFTYVWLKFMVDVGKYSSPMEHMGIARLPGKFPKRSRVGWFQATSMPGEVQDSSVLFEQEAGP